MEHLLAIEGLELSACSAGIYPNGRNDLALLSFNDDANSVAVFTRNAFCAAPVVLARKHIKNEVRHCLINAGNANAGMGNAGYQDSLMTCQRLAELTNCATEGILPFSTGVIGQPLPVKKICDALPELIQKRTAFGWQEVATAIMTTDTMAKGISRVIEFMGEQITITGIAKGSGMIQPNMATMLAFIATDAKIQKSVLQKLLNDAVAQSFHCISVDGDTSTNDACVLIATGKSIAISNEKLLSEFKKALSEICIYLAKSIVRDGEGVTKFITIRVENGKTVQECKQAAMRIANSLLVKTAFFASDANWGRILAALGNSGLDKLNIDNVSISLDDVEVITEGKLATDYTEERGASIMARKEITIYIDIARGTNMAEIWTCDLSHEYIRINAEYRS